ncbi:MAG: OmpH family outer membrane protein [Oceanococcaceae bacterium]
MTRILLVALATMITSTAVMAQSRIAVINSARLLTESPQYQAAGESMQKEFKARAEALEKDARALAADLEKFKKDAEIMSSTERAKREKDLNTRRIDISYAERKLKEDVAIRERELTQDLMQEFQSVIEKVATENKYDLVLQDPVYAAKSTDITDTVLARLKSAKR